MSNATPMSRADYLCALAVVFIWGVNFAVMKFALQTMPPFFLGAWRYILACLPLLLLIRPPKVKWQYVVAYGLTQCVGQFGILFVAISLGMAAGIASLVLQTQAFFTVLLAAAILRERTRPIQWVGLALATAGLGLIAASHGEGPGQMTLIGFTLTLAAALMWAVSNLLVRFAARSSPGYDPFAFIVWTSVVAVPPFIAMTLIFEGPQRIGEAFSQIGWTHWASAAYLGLASTLVGYTLWTRLLKRHPSSRVAPFSLLVPIVGLATAAVTFDEWLTRIQWLGAAGVLLGLLINQFGTRLLARLYPA